MKNLSLKIYAEIIDLDENEVLTKQELNYNASSAGIHDALDKMGHSFLYGLASTLSRKVLGLLEEKDKIEKEKKIV